jgi:BirA family biotin operon repressor/biotin-[acetyl-CoA-carboxylase] ligase
MSAPVPGPALGSPRVHLRQTDSTNLRARELALAGAPHGTLVTADEQLAGRGRQGRRWTAPAGQALLMSVIVRDPPPLLSLAAGIAVARVAQAHDPDGRRAALKWPNDVLLAGGKVAGILVEARPQAGWAVLGIGLNVAVEREALPPDVRRGAASLGLTAAAIEPTLTALLAELAGALTMAPARLLARLRERDALRGRDVAWAGGSGVAAGIDEQGRLLVQRGDETLALDAGEVHLLG